jgi:hypothetical protein
MRLLGWHEEHANMRRPDRGSSRSRVPHRRQIVIP